MDHISLEFAAYFDFAIIIWLLAATH